MSSPAPESLVEQVVERFAQTPDPRLRELLGALVRHLHAFIEEARPTEREWMQGLEFLTTVGQTCDDRRQEFILLSDVLGASMQVVAVQAQQQAGCTESTVFGPFHVEGAPTIEYGGDLARGARGEPCHVAGTVRAADGTPIADALIDAWQADDDGLYDVQRSDLASAQGRGVLRSRADGSFAFTTVLPMPYPIPTDGPVGRLLDATRRSPWRPAHLHFRVQAPGFRTLITHVFRAGDPHLSTDPVFGVRPSLVADWPVGEDGRRRLRFDLVLQPQS